MSLASSLWYATGLSLNKIPFWSETSVCLSISAQNLKDFQRNIMGRDSRSRSQHRDRKNRRHHRQHDSRAREPSNNPGQLMAWHGVSSHFDWHQQRMRLKKRFRSWLLFPNSSNLVLRWLTRLGIWCVWIRYRWLLQPSWTGLHSSGCSLCCTPILFVARCDSWYMYSDTYSQDGKNSENFSRTLAFINQTMPRTQIGGLDSPC